MVKSFTATFLSSMFVSGLAIQRQDLAVSVNSLSQLISELMGSGLAIQH